MILAETGADPQLFQYLGVLLLALVVMTFAVGSMVASKLAGWFFSDFGDLNQVTHIWAYNDLKHLKEGKDAVTADPEWTGTYIPRGSGLLVAQNTYLMNTSEFAPVPE